MAQHAIVAKWVRRWMGDRTLKGVASLCLILTMPGCLMYRWPLDANASPQPARRWIPVQPLYGNGRLAHQRTSTRNGEARGKVAPKNSVPVASGLRKQGGDVVRPTQGKVPTRAIAVEVPTRTAPKPQQPGSVPATAASASSATHRVATRYPLSWPLEGPITSRFGRQPGRNVHDGIDIRAPKGTKVKAAGAGEVLFASKHGGYGNLVVVRHDDGLVTVYAHHDVNLVHKGDRVKAGQYVGRVGQTGRASGPHLHFEVRRGVTPENPLRYLPP